MRGSAGFAVQGAVGCAMRASPGLCKQDPSAFARGIHRLVQGICRPSGSWRGPPALQTRTLGIAGGSIAAGGNARRPWQQDPSAFARRDPSASAGVPAAIGREQSTRPFWHVRLLPYVTCCLAGPLCHLLPRRHTGADGESARRGPRDPLASAKRDPSAWARVPARSEVSGHSPFRIVLLAAASPGLSSAGLAGRRHGRSSPGPSMTSGASIADTCYWRSASPSGAAAGTLSASARSTRPLPRRIGCGWPGSGAQPDSVSSWKVAGIRPARSPNSSR